VARKAENAVSAKIIRTISLSPSGPSEAISLTRVTGAFLLFSAINLPSSRTIVGLTLILLCSTNPLTLVRKKKEFKIAGRIAITATISTPPTIAIAPYIAPSAKVPESPGNILDGNLWNKKKAKQTIISGIAASARITFPFRKRARTRGTVAIATKPLTAPLRTSIVLMVFAVTGIAMRINIG